MVDEQKVKTMTKLAIYEKNIGKEDLKINTYYKHDYILVNNIKTRILVTIGMLILLGGHALLQFFGFLDLTKTINLIKLGITYGVIYILIVVIYTIISTRIYAKRYNEAQARLSGYKKLLKRISNYESNNEK